jgi:ABC-type multidrug transport system permease subunit
MRRVLHLAFHDTRLFVVGWDSLFYMLIMPVMFMLFFSAVFRGDNDPRAVTVSLPVVDEGGGWLAEAFVGQLKGERFEVAVHTPAAADTLNLTRQVRIPASFTDSLLAGRPVELKLIKAASSNLEYDFAADVRLHRAQVAFLGNLVRWDGERTARAGQTEGGGQALGALAARAGAALAGNAGIDLGGLAPRPAEGPALPVTEADRARLLELVAEPSRVTVASSHAGRGRPVPSGAGQSIPGMLAMFVVMTALIGGSESLTREKHAGTLARLATTPFSRGEILGGKLLHLSLVAVTQALVLMAAGELLGRLHVFGIDFTWGAGWPAIVALVLYYGVAVGCLTLFVSGLFRTTQQSESLAWLIGMVMAAMGGCWWPMEIMPGPARALAHAFPTYWAMEGLHGVITFGRGAAAIVLPIVVLSGFALLFGLLGARTMKLR